jgi:hypothetical protein
MRKLLLLTLLFIGCNNAVTVESTSGEQRLAYFYDTAEEAAKGYFLDYTGIYSEQISFIESNRKDIEDSFEVREIITVADNYNFVFVDFFVGTDRFREVVRVKKGFDGKFWPFDYFSCYDLPCEDGIDDKIDDWNEDNIRKHLNPYD